LAALERFARWLGRDLEAALRWPDTPIPADELGRHYEGVDSARQPLWCALWLLESNERRDFLQFALACLLPYLASLARKDGLGRIAARVEAIDLSDIMRAAEGLRHVLHDLKSSSVSNWTLSTQELEAANAAWHTAWYLLKEPPSDIPWSMTWSVARSTTKAADADGGPAAKVSVANELAEWINLTLAAGYDDELPQPG